MSATNTRINAPTLEPNEERKVKGKMKIKKPASI